MINELIEFLFVAPGVRRAMQCPHGGHATRRELSREVTKDGVQSQVEVTEATRHGVNAVTVHTMTLSGQSGPPNPTKVLK